MPGPALSLADLRSYDPEANLNAQQARACCPACGDGKPRDKDHRSISLNTATGLYNCKRCGASGKLTDFWEHKEPLHSTPVRSKRRGWQPMTVTPIVEPKQTEPDPDSVAGFERAYSRCGPLEGTPGAAYLEGRCIPCELATTAGVKYASSWGKDIRGAVVFSVFGVTGEPIAAQGRAIEGSGKQTRGPLKLGAFYTPGALDADPVAICEAPIDALSLAAVGLPSIAMCGCSGIPSWLSDRLSTPARPGFSRTVYTATDADDAGDEAALKLFDLFPLCTVKRLRPAGAKDWNAILTGHGLDELRQQVTAPTISTTAAPLPMTDHEHYEAYGWARFYSNILDRWVIIKRDASVRLPRGLTVKYGHGSR